MNYAELDRPSPVDEETDKKDIIPDHNNISEEQTKREIRVTVPGHTQRGGAPCAYDRVLATRVGAYAAELILNKEYGYMVGIVDGDTKKVPLSEVAGKLKYVDPKCQMIKDAKTIGISFGE